MNRVNSGLAAGILSLTLGCSSIRTGFGYRQVSGDYRFYRYKGAIPFVRVRGDKELGRNLGDMCKAILPVERWVLSRSF
ncbi:MAG: hypothetical protein KKD18_04050 [Nanoarchaeota archaeon]|nr:hypothetical protein [Nanoarchaeota archaeon]MBU0977565.1 hypothetical protein [Nanoarchaeota archaeon]